MQAGDEESAVDMVGPDMRAVGVDVDVPVEGGRPRRGRPRCGDPLTDDDRRGVLMPEHAAYTIFTSGSTGRPKGVTVPHRALLATMELDSDLYGFTDSDVFAQVLDYTFDPAMLEFLRSALVGAPLVMLAPGAHRDPHAIAASIASARVTTAVIVPSMPLAAMIETLDSDLEWASSLRIVCTGGENLTAAVAEAVALAWPHVALYNQYGPTETTIYHAR